MKEKSPRETSAKSSSRRQFFNKIWLLLGLAAMAEFIYLAVSVLNSRKTSRRQTQEKTIITAGPIEQFGPATVTAVVQGQFYLARRADGSVLALSRTCTHLGCSVPWDEEKKQFICPCHGSTFDLNGDVLSPPAPRPLDYYPVRIENGIVKVDISTPQQRARFEPAQATKI